MKRQIVAILLTWTCAITQLSAQPFVERQQAPILWRPYKSPTVPPVSLTNSDRLHSLIRNGKLYLTLQDAIALAIENNLDLEIDRYGPLSAEWSLERQRAGGPLKGSSSSSGTSAQVIAGQGVLGAISAAGLTNNGNNGNNNQNTGTFSQVGPITPNLDPTLVSTTTFGHFTTPQANQTISATSALVDITHNYSNYIQQGFLSGGLAQVYLSENYLNENSRNDILNPNYAPYGYVFVRHNFLSGFGIAMNRRYITVAEKQLVASNVQFRSQLLNLVAMVVSQYWDLTASRSDLTEKQEAQDFAQKFFEDTKREISLGAVAGVDIFRAQSELSTRKQDITLAQETLSQQETQLKSLLSRNGLGDPLLESAEIVPLDHIEVPKSDDLPPLRDLLAIALEKRPDVLLDKINDEISQISALGTANGVLPQLQGRAYMLNRGSSGPYNPESGKPPIPSAIGGLGNAFGQLFRHDFTTSSVGLSYSAPIHNRQDMADYEIDQLNLRQGDLVERRNRNQLVVDISNDTIALRQARLRYTNAVATRELQRDLLEKEQQKFRLGSSTIDLIIVQARAFTAAEAIEVQALATYARTRAALDQVLGTTLETNHVSVQEAMKGHVDVESVLPKSLPEGGQK